MEVCIHQTIVSTRLTSGTAFEQHVYLKYPLAKVRKMDRQRDFMHIRPLVHLDVTDKI
jgi:hypothetical protein